MGGGGGVGRVGRWPVKDQLPFLAQLKLWECGLGRGEFSIGLV